ncbi:hypothetical protein SK128_015162 [Halocaridina rubra]|uniref:VWFA domain-containing protein n=1 Tax=Halocaridina rubra TaxID=373956 RepID=A0AAN8WD48_HALRR
MDEDEEAFHIYTVEEEEGEQELGKLGNAKDGNEYQKGNKRTGEKRHTLLKIPSRLPKELCNFNEADQVFNIVMADTSGSMEKRWPLVINAWQEYVAPKLNGRTRMYAFDYQVRSLGCRKHFTNKDYGGYATDLTAALETIRLEVEKSLEANIRVFIITDGGHNYNSNYKEPETEIIQMKPPDGKVIGVYLLGIGLEFPVNYSIDIRSRLHNWKANVPTLFWAKEDSDIEDQIRIISEEIVEKPTTLKLNVEGYIVPGLDKVSFIQLGEWLYFPQSPEELPMLQVEGHEEKSLTIHYRDITLRQLVDELFLQWNSVLIQQHRRKATVPTETLSLMRSLFNGTLKKVKEDSCNTKSLKTRLQVKHQKTYSLKFSALMNQTKNILTITHKFTDEIKLAEALLKTTVTPKNKYAQKVLMMKGHGQNNFESDAKEFRKLYKAAEDQIMKLPTPQLEECCRILATSTLVDLQDPYILLMLDESKYDFMKTFTMSGMPVYASIKDFSHINPWTMIIHHIVGAPYAIISQSAIELYADQAIQFDSEEKSVILTKGNIESKCNIVIPIIPANAAEVLQPLICSNLYAMMATFSILRNPHIIDHDIHLAALGCAWLTTIRTHPLCKRPQYIRERLDNITATAKIYTKRSSVKTYVNALIDNPNQALMTLSTQTFEGHYIMCESLVKPMFLLYLMKDRLTDLQKEQMLKMLLAEFIGRTLPLHTNKMATPFTKLFAKNVYDQNEKKTWAKKNHQVLMKQVKNCKTLLAQFYTVEELETTIKKEIKDTFYSLTENHLDDDNLCVNMTMIQKLSNVGKCGNVRASDFKVWAEEIGVISTIIRKAASPKQIAVYVVEALQNRHSRYRESKAAMAKADVMSIIREKVKQETSCSYRITVTEELTSRATRQWEEEYMSIHKAVAMPMTPAEIIRNAQEKGIQVDDNNFHLVYRYNDKVELLRNACQISGCPHFLVPHRNFNQHLTVERRMGNFPHALHLVSKKFCTEDTRAVMREVTKGTLSGTQNRTRHSPPDTQDIKPLEKEISNLIHHYKNNEEKLKEIEADNR